MSIIDKINPKFPTLRAASQSLWFLFQYQLRDFKTNELYYSLDLLEHILGFSRPQLLRAIEELYNCSIITYQKSHRKITKYVLIESVSLSNKTLPNSFILSNEMLPKNDSLSNKTLPIESQNVTQGLDVDNSADIPINNNNDNGLEKNNSEILSNKTLPHLSYLNNISIAAKDDLSTKTRTIIKKIIDKYNILPNSKNHPQSQWQGYRDLIKVYSYELVMRKIDEMDIVMNHNEIFRTLRGYCKHGDNKRFIPANGLTEEGAVKKLRGVYALRVLETLDKDTARKAMVPITLIEATYPELIGSMESDHEGLTALIARIKEASHVL